MPYMNYQVTYSLDKKVVITYDCKDYLTAIDVFSALVIEHGVDKGLVTVKIVRLKDAICVTIFETIANGLG